MKPYYQAKGITIYNGDCREILPTLPKVDLVLTDPPYESEAHTLQRRVKRPNGGPMRVANVEPLSFAPMTEETRESVARMLAALACGWVLTFCQIEAAHTWRSAYERYGLCYKRTCIWVKPDGMPQLTGDRPGMGYESFVSMHAPGKSAWNGGGRHGVFVFSKRDPGMGSRKNLHPTQKPMALAECLVGLFSNPGALLLDPFMGSGTTLVAAQNLNRQAIGIELEEKYCEIAVNRLEGRTSLRKAA